jgi:hypothetical protein
MSVRRGLDRLAFQLFAVAALVVVVAVPVAIAVGRNMGAGTPASTVRGFLVDTLDADGFGACQYLSPNGVLEVRAMAPPNTDCEAVLPWARFQLGTHAVDRESQVKALHYAVRESRSRATVTVSLDGVSRTVQLRRATATELDAYLAPPTPWRLDSGLTTLLPPLSVGV